MYPSKPTFKVLKSKSLYTTKMSLEQKIDWINQNLPQKNMFIAFNSFGIDGKMSCVS